MKRQVLLLILCSLLVLLFVYSGVNKWVHFQQFSRDMKNQPFPEWFSHAITVTLPSIEIIIAILIFFESTRTSGLYSYLVLMSLFTFYAILILSHVFPYVPCGCGGVIRALKWPQHLILNLIFIVIAGTAIYLHKKEQRDTLQTR